MNKLTTSERFASTDADRCIVRIEWSTRVSWSRGQIGQLSPPSTGTDTIAAMVKNGLFDRRDGMYVLVVIDHPGHPLDGQRAGIDSDKKLPWAIVEPDDDRFDRFGDSGELEGVIEWFDADLRQHAWPRR